MLAATSLAGITFVSSTSIKKLSEELPLTVVTEATPSSAAWSPDRSSLIFTQGRHVYCSPADRHQDTELLHTDYGGDGISHIVCPNSLAAIYSAGSRIMFITHSPSKVYFSVEAKYPITSLSLSMDGLALLYTTATSAHILSLPTKSSTALRGLTLSDNTDIRASTMHPHTRGRALLAAGRSLLVYDVTRPSAPLKVIGTGGSETLVFLTWSPFSRTLVAAGTASGYVHLIDLEKEKR